MYCTYEISTAFKEECSQLHADTRGELVQRSEADRFHLNVAKCKELRVTFSRLGSAVAPVISIGSFSNRELDQRCQTKGFK